MQSLRELLTIGVGPSSSHTMGPRKAALSFKNGNLPVNSYRVTLYGSLSATGKGHLTNTAIVDALAPVDCEIVWSKESLAQHPNGMLFESLDENGNVLESQVYFSPGGGAIVKEGESRASKDVYKLSTFDEIRHWSDETGKPIWKYVEEREGEEIWDYLKEIWETMKKAVKRGVQTEDVLPGVLKLKRRSRGFFLKSKWSADHLKRTGLLAAYALAVSEENAAGGVIVIILMEIGIVIKK